MFLEGERQPYAIDRCSDQNVHVVHGELSVDGD